MGRKTIDFYVLIKKYHWLWEKEICKFYFLFLFLFSLTCNFLGPTPKADTGTFVLHIMETINCDELELFLTDGHACLHSQYYAKLDGPSNSQQVNLSWKQKKDSKHI